MTGADKTDALVGIGLALVAGAAAIWVIPNQAVPGDEGEIAPAMLPLVAATLIAGLGIIQAVIPFVSRSDAPAPFDLKSFGFAVMATMYLGLALLALSTIGYWGGGIVIILAAGIAMRPQGSARIWMILIALALPSATFYLAWHGLRLALP